MEQGESVSEIKIFLDDLRNSVIGFENYKSYFEKVRNTDMVIATQIGKLKDDYKKLQLKLNDYTSKDYFKQNYDDGIVQIELFELQSDMNSSLMEAYTWKSLEEEMYNIIFMKIYSVLDDARALDIKRDALKEMREMDKEKQEMFIQVFENMATMFKETTISKLQNYDEKIFNLILMNDEEHRKDRRDMYVFFVKLVNKLGLGNDAESLLEDVNLEYEPKSEKIYKNMKENKVEVKKGNKDDFGSYEEEDVDDDGNQDILKKFDRKNGDKV